MVLKTLKETQREILLADPNIVNLHRIGMCAVLDTFLDSIY